MIGTVYKRRPYFTIRSTSWAKQLENVDAIKQKEYVIQFPNNYHQH